MSASDDNDRVRPLRPQAGDALLVVDVQNDFLPGGALPVPQGDQVLAPINRCIDLFVARGLPIVLTRDWHPANHCSFHARGGPWPPHCVAGTAGAEFAAELRLPPRPILVSKATAPDVEAYSDLEGTDLDARLRGLGVKRLFVGGLATEYCVRATVLDALRLGFEAAVILDAIRPINVQPDDGRRAVEEMRRHGAVLTTSEALS